MVTIEWAQQKKLLSPLKMDNNKKFMLRSIMRVIMAIIDIIMISLNSTTGTKIVKHITDVHVCEQ